jgi:hypothetical protein
LPPPPFLLILDLYPALTDIPGEAFFPNVVGRCSVPSLASFFPSSLNTHCHRQKEPHLHQHVEDLFVLGDSVEPRIANKASSSQFLRILLSLLSFCALFSSLGPELSERVFFHLVILPLGSHLPLFFSPSHRIASFATGTRMDA